MKRLLVVKVGDTLPALAARRGDFEDWILAGMSIDERRAVVVDVRTGVGLPAYSDLAGVVYHLNKPGQTRSGRSPDRARCGSVGRPATAPQAYSDPAGVVITGSHAMVTERADWSEQTAAWLPGLVERGIPVLGICYGHQLLAHALGGTVGDNPLGREYGTVDVHLTDEAHADALLGALPTPVRVQVSHTQSVLALPAGARRLAWSDGDPNQAFVVGERAWGVQFHPEFDRDVVVTYIDRYRQALIDEGQDPDRLIEMSEDTIYGSMILSRFGQVVEQA